MRLLQNLIEPAALGAEEVGLDPYAYQPGIRSRIAGLVDGPIGVDPNYVFHTDYVPLGRGHVDVTLRFADLRAKEGTLMVRVHLFREGQQPALVLVTSQRIQLNRLVQQGGELTIRFEAFNECRYATMGVVVGDTDATASALQVAVRRPVEIADEDYHTEARNTDFGRDRTRPEPLLVSTRPPTLAAPVTQVATLDQLDSAAAKALIREAAPASGGGRDTEWSLAYTVRCLEAYGVLSADARGLCLGGPDDPVARLLARRGQAVDHLLDADGRPARTTERLANYDFLWRHAPTGEVASRQEWCEEVERILKSVLPGGLVVLTFGYDPTPPTDKMGPPDGPTVIDRIAVERLALLMVSRNHEVAQVRMAGLFEPLALSGGAAPSIAGFVMRRARIAG